MNDIIKNSVENIESYLSDEHAVFYRMLKGKQQSYFAKYIVDEKLARFFVDIYPLCYCEKPYLVMTRYYASKMNSTYKSGRIDVDENCGVIKIRIDSSISEHSISTEEIKAMECLAIQIAEEITPNISRLCHGVPPDDYRPDVLGEMERKISQLIGDGCDDDENDTETLDGLDDFDEVLDKADADDSDSEGEDAESDKDTDKEASNADKSFDDLFPKEDDDD